MWFKKKNKHLKSTNLENILPIDSILKNWASQARIEPVIALKNNECDYFDTKYGIYYVLIKGKLVIMSKNMGRLIGKNGELVNKYKEILIKSIPEINNVELYELANEV